jgi:adenylate kinase
MKSKTLCNFETAKLPINIKFCGFTKIMTMAQREQQLERLRNLRDTHLIKVITGIRRAGKSTLFKQFQQELLVSGVDERNIISPLSLTCLLL